MKANVVRAFDPPVLRTCFAPTPFSRASGERHGTARDLRGCPVKPCWFEGGITKLTAKFDTWREANMTVERLVQQFETDRAKIVVTADGDETPPASRRTVQATRQASLAPKLATTRNWMAGWS